MSTDTRTEPDYYRTAPTMAYPHGRVLRIGTDGTMALHDQGQWRDLARAATTPGDAHAITAHDAAERIG